MRTAARNTRSWTDEQLRDAVGARRSLRQVAEALGLASGATHGLQRHINRLGLATSHFVGRRAWSEDQLASAVPDARSWKNLLLTLGVPAEDPDALLRLKGDATRLGLDTSHLREPAPMPKLETPPSRDRLALSDAAASIAAAWLIARGFPTSFPTEQRPYDLLTEFSDGIKRLQVKSSASRTGQRWQVSVGRRRYSMNKTAGKDCYDPGEIDDFFVVAADGSLYLLPVAVLGGRIRIHLEHYQEYQVGSAASLLAPAG